MSERLHKGYDEGGPRREGERDARRPGGLSCQLEGVVTRQTTAAVDRDRWGVVHVGLCVCDLDGAFMSFVPSLVYFQRRGGGGNGLGFGLHGLRCFGWHARQHGMGLFGSDPEVGCCGKTTRRRVTALAKVSDVFWEGMMARTDRLGERWMAWHDRDWMRLGQDGREVRFGRWSGFGDCSGHMSGGLGWEEGKRIGRR